MDQSGKGEVKEEEKEEDVVVGRRGGVPLGEGSSVMDPGRPR
jgi:hypothetical protein